MSNVNKESIRRTGLVATKLGMTRVCSKDMTSIIPVTLLKIERNIVLDIKTIEKNGYNALVLGYGERKNMKKPQLGVAKKVGISSFKAAKEFRVSSSCLLKVGDILSAAHFVEGQYIDVTGISLGKGFAGCVKRYGFATLESSHGVSLTKRAIGSTGTRDGKVKKNKKMPGHMGCRRVTLQNSQIIDIDLQRNIIAVKGGIPGADGSIILLRDAIKQILPPNVIKPGVLANKEETIETQ